MIKKYFMWFIANVFFYKKRALAFCGSIALISYITEYFFCIENLFSSSGAIFTIAGLFLNIKLTAIFHLKLPNGEPLGVSSKHSIISGHGTFGGGTPKEEQERKVKEVESDEVWGASLMVIGTLIWGYGSYFI